MYALVNTMTKNETAFGTVISRHHTTEACRAADKKLQNAHNRAGGGAYTPTVIVSGSPKALTGHALKCECELVDWF